MIVYKIRDKTTGLYTDGGRYALSRFNKHGKFWFSLKEVLAFLRYFLNDRKKFAQHDTICNRFYRKGQIAKESIIDEKDIIEYLPDNWEIVICEMNEVGSVLAKEFWKEQVKK